MNFLITLLFILTALELALSETTPEKPDDAQPQTKRGSVKTVKELLDLMDPAHRPHRTTAKYQDCVIPFIYETEKEVFIFYDCTKTLNPQTREWCGLKHTLLENNSTYGDWGFCV